MREPVTASAGVTVWALTWTVVSVMPNMFTTLHLVGECLARDERVLAEIDALSGTGV